MSAEKHITGIPEVNDLASELQEKKLQLHWLLQISKAINYNFSTKQLLDVYEHVLHSQLKVERLALLIHEHQWKCALLYGTDKGFQDFDLEKILDELNSLHNLETEKELWIKCFDTIIPVFHKDRILAYALVGGMNNTSIPRKNELVPFIQTITNLIVVAIENNIVSEEKIRQAGIKKELELAAQMQNMLFPVSLPRNEKYELHATYLPHQEVGGDYYDYIPVSDDEFVFCMADVSGKGIPAALLMSNFQANLHAYVMHNATLTELVKQLNANVFNSAKGEKFITFFIGRYHAKSRELQYINAGHNPPFLLHDKVVYMLNEGCTGLGMFEELPFINTGKVFIPVNALIHCYTDGVIEVEDNEGTEFGLERLREFLISKMNVENIEDAQKQLVNRLFAYKQNRSYTDDITLLSCRFGDK
ncbi:MAG: PP2C family protein-serine/threonine phosphatase [Bacteroidetes bacterium]|nr:PP2C family protein-serine/threonine phosphatase [Bacteroidota bacterium]